MVKWLFGAKIVTSSVFTYLQVKSRFNSNSKNFYAGKNIWGFLQYDFWDYGQNIETSRAMALKQTRLASQYAMTFANAFVIIGHDERMDTCTPKI